MRHPQIGYPARSRGWLEPMFILWLNHRDFLNPRGGGAERTIHSVAADLVARGHDVEVLTSLWPGASSDEFVNGVHIRRLPSYFGPHIALPLRLWSLPRPDVVVEDLAHVVPWMSRWFSSVPTVSYFRHLHRRTLEGQVSRIAAALLDRVERSYAGGQDDSLIVTESQQSVQDLLALGIGRDRIRRIPPGVDTALFRATELAPYPLLVYFAGLREYKRPEHSLYVLQRVAKHVPEVRLAVVGAGPSLRSMRTVSRELGVEAHVKFTGRLADSDLAAIVASAWVNLHFSRAEGWGLSICEARAAGVPTVAYSAPGVSETVVHSVNGILVEDGDVAAAAAATIGVIEGHASWRSRCIADDEVRPWRVTGAEWEVLLREVIQLRPGRR